MYGSRGNSDHRVNERDQTLSPIRMEINSNITERKSITVSRVMINIELMNAKLFEEIC